MPIVKNIVDVAKFNPKPVLPYELRLQDFQMAMQDVYDFFYDVNFNLTAKGLQRLDDMLRPAVMSECFPTCSRPVLRSTRAYCERTDISTAIRI